MVITDFEFHKNVGIVPIIGMDSSGLEIAKILALEEKRHKLPPLPPVIGFGFSQQLPYEELYNFDCKLNMESLKKSIEMCKNGSYMLSVYKNGIIKPNLNVLYRYSKGLYTSCKSKKLN